MLLYAIVVQSTKIFCLIQVTTKYYLATRNINNYQHIPNCIPNCRILTAKNQVETLALIKNYYHKITPRYITGF